MRVNYFASATEQEILRGVQEMEGAENHVFCFNRAIVTADGATLVDVTPTDDAMKDFIDYLEADGRWVPDRSAHDRLLALRERVSRRLGVNIRTYTANWTGSGITLDHLGVLPDTLDDCLALLNQTDQPSTLCGDVWRCLATIILGQLAKIETEEVAAEVAAHQTFGESRSRVFVCRDQPLDEIAKYIGAGENRPLALIGEPGSGKSALMAKAFEQTRLAHPNAAAIVRYISATPASSEGRLLLASMCRQIARAYGADESVIPTAYSELEIEFPSRLMHATADKPLIVFIDALDQLGPDDQAHDMRWMPAVLPDHVRFVVSTVPGYCDAALRTRSSAPRFLTLDRMTRQEGDLALEQWLAQAGRTLRDEQRCEVLDRFEPEGRPLYLKLAFEEARLWHSYTDSKLSRLNPGISKLIMANLFKRLEEPRNHGRVLVTHALGYLAASRFGLAEDELIELLSPKSPDINGLPVVVWSRLYFDIEPYLFERASEGATLLSFYHRQIQEAVTLEFMNGVDGVARHMDLAHYFRRKADPAGNGSWSGGSVRGLAELPYQLAEAGTPEGLGTLHDLLTDYLFLQHKLAEVGVRDDMDAYGGLRRTHAGVHFLRDDLRMALARLRGETVSGKKPLIVTAADRGVGLEVLCPWCNGGSTIQPAWRGSEIACPKCREPLMVNAFVAEGL